MTRTAKTSTASPRLIRPGSTRYACPSISAVVVAHRALLRGCPHDRPADDVREADLARGDLLVELLAPRLEHRDVDIPEAGGGRDTQAGHHVLREPRRGALDRGGSLGDRRSRRDLVRPRLSRAHRPGPGGCRWLRWPAPKPAHSHRPRSRTGSATRRRRWRDRCDTARRDRRRSRR